MTRHDLWLLVAVVAVAVGFWLAWMPAGVIAAGAGAGLLWWLLDDVGGDE